jgi:hypothetical protein
VFGVLGKENEAARRPPRFLSSVPVWPSGDWLPHRCVDCSTQVHGRFGLAVHLFPGNRMTKHEAGSVEELARQAEALAATAPSVLAIAADGVADARQVDADLVRAARLEPHTEQGRPG